MVRRSRPGRLLAGATVLSLTSFLPAGAAQAAPGAAGRGSGDPTSKTCDPLIAFRSGNFAHSTTIDNTFLPMPPGTRLTYQGHVTSGGGGTQKHEVVFTVTDLVKDVAGVQNRVIYDVDQSDGVVTEAELAFFAQDDAGNVWNLGEYPEEYDNGKFSGAPSVWITGLQGATGGLHMLAHAEHRLGTPEYLQGIAPAIDFLDCARIAEKNGTVAVPAGHFTDVLTTHERSPLESTTAIQTKEHAPGVGIVRIGALNDPEAEVLDLVSVEHLQGSDLRTVDHAAFALDRHGHKVSDVYSRTPRLHRDEGNGSHGSATTTGSVAGG
jgi:hypothetical protein